MTTRPASADRHEREPECARLSDGACCDATAWRPCLAEAERHAQN
ncbi:hypothetical protein ACFYXD_15130 [Streptomyces platensis]